jgi:hypothetical protein
LNAWRSWRDESNKPGSSARVLDFLAAGADDGWRNPEFRFVLSEGPLAEQRIVGLATGR